MKIVSERINALVLWARGKQILFSHGDAVAVCEYNKQGAPISIVIPTKEKHELNISRFIRENGLGEQKVVREITPQELDLL